MPSISSRAARSAATAIALTAATGAASVANSAHAQSTPQAVQWRTQDGGNGHWYQFVPYGVLATWSEAATYAVDRGGHLATIRSAAEQAFAYQRTMDGSCEPAGTVWLGADQPTGSAPNAGWRWVTGEPWGYTNWSAGEPNDYSGWPEDCLVMLRPGGSWYDIRKDGFASPACTRSALIEWSADCNGDGIVDYGQCRDGSLPDYNGNNIPDCCEQGVPCEVGRYPVQWREADGGNGHWYQLRPKVGDWIMCRSDSRSSGGDLATPSTASENAFLEPLVPAPQFPVWNRVFIGGRQVMGAGSLDGWYWVDGSPWEFANWEANQPDGGEGFLAMYRGSSTSVWGDYGIDSGEINYHLVEWSSDCNGDGIVDFGQILRGELADTNQDGVPNICQCPGDVTLNNVVDGVDLAAVLSSWGTGGQGQFRTDIDSDGVVSGTDLAFVLSGWGPCPQ